MCDLKTIAAFHNQKVSFENKILYSICTNSIFVCIEDTKPKLILRFHSSSLLSSSLSLLCTEKEKLERGLVPSLMHMVETADNRSRDCRFLSVREKEPRREPLRAEAGERSEDRVRLLSFSEQDCALGTYACRVYVGAGI